MRNHLLMATALCLLLPQGLIADNLELEWLPVATRLNRVTTITHAGDGTERIFIAEQTGQIRIIRPDGSTPEQPFLDISSLVDSTSLERGLLALAFHPMYEKNGRFFVVYTDRDSNAVLSRFQVSADDPDLADADTEDELLSLAQPTTIHAVHHLDFGPQDGYLYVASGDGGPGGDPSNNAQSLDVLLGKILRLDVDQVSGYAIPPDNPFVGNPVARDEVWSFGLRNPANFSFDRATGALYIGDVGESTWEEINYQPPGSTGGENYGWRRMEGPDCFDPPGACDRTGVTLPIAQYRHGPDCAVIGGYVYRGSRQLSLTGIFLFADYCTGDLRVARQGCGGWWSEVIANPGLQITTMG
ncbi:MAG: PQQ-dependent sugar dehydrogenase [Acidobacteriota bacterium]